MTDETNTPMPREDMLRLAVNIVTAYVGNNPLPAGQIPELIQTVYTSLNGLGQGPAETKAEAQKPAVPIRKSVFPDHIVCLEDGKKLKMLKRHLRTNPNYSSGLAGVA